VMSTLPYRHPLARIDSLLFLLAFLFGWQLSLLMKLDRAARDARRHDMRQRGDLADARDVVARYASEHNGNRERTIVAPEEGPAEVRADAGDE
jgi:hypothetical protein